MYKAMIYSGASLMAFGMITFLVIALSGNRIGWLSDTFIDWQMWAIFAVAIGYGLGIAGCLMGRHQCARKLKKLAMEMRKNANR